MLSPSEIATPCGKPGTTSPFNITADALTLPTFTRADLEDLVAQHTAATGQRFEPDAVARVFDLSQGHPWLVSALADQTVHREVPIPNRSGHDRAHRVDEGEDHPGAPHAHQLADLQAA